MTLRKTTAWVVAALMAFTAPALMAQTMGRITGTIVDNTGAAVPGVTITITSPSLQGSSSQTTDSSGKFRFPSVPPGTYKVRAELAGFKTVEQTDVRVALDRTVDLSLKMEVAAVVETITVEGAAPAIDTSSTSTGVNAGTDLFNRLPVQRDVYSIARVAPGTKEDVVGTVVYGSTGAENQYIIEGLNTTGVELGDKGKTLNFDFVQEIEVKTGGLPAEYGRMTGGVINVLTKTGGNEFHGSVFGFTEGGSLQADDATASLRPATTTTIFDIAHKRDYGFELGGYLVKDKVWFFGAYNRVDQQNQTTVIRQLTTPGSPAIGQAVPADITRDLFAGKLTWRLSDNHTLTGSVFGDPSKREGQIFNIAGPASTWQGTRKTGSTDIVARYDGVFGSSFLIRAMYGHHSESDKFEGAGRNQAQIINQRVSPTALSGGWGFFGDQTFTRDVGRLDLTKFVGGHEFKLGGDIEELGSVTDNYQGGQGQRIYLLRTGAGLEYVRHRYYIDDRAPGFNAADPSTFRVLAPFHVEPETRNLSAYLQDAWKIGRNFTLNLGVRWEGQEAIGRTGPGTTSLKISDNWAPRAGFIWDVKGNGKSKLYANFGRFYESIPMDINIRAFGGEFVCFCNNFSADPAVTAPAPGAPRSAALGGHATPVADDLKGQYLDEYLGGFEYEVAPNFVLGVKGTYRKLGRVIEDFLVNPDIGEYAIANPGEGQLGRTMYFYDYVTSSPMPKAERKSTAFELTARKRFSNNWQMLASYVYNKLEGNYDGTFQASTGQLDPNINSGFDYADFSVNAYGNLTNDRRHQFKFDGSYQFGSGALDGLNLGLSTHWYSGAPLNAYGYSFAYANWEYYLAPRGSLGRGPSEWEADLHVSYPFKVGEKVRMNFIADVFNLFDRQESVLLDERFNLPNNGRCAGIPAAICNGDNGLIARPNSFTPAGAINTSNAPNPDFHRAGVAFTGQRSIRLGLRLTF